VEPLRPFRRLVDQLGELRFDPAGERRRFGAPPSRERSCHVLDTITASADRSRSDLPDPPHDVRPPVDYWQHRVRLLRREHRHHARDPHLCQALHPIKILAEAEQGDFDGCGIAAGLPRHSAEFRQHFGNIAAGRWDPAIPIPDRAACAIRESAADMDRRVRFLHRFGPGDHRIEVDELPMVFGLRIRPDLPYENLKGIISATQIAEEIRARIRAETELTASAGVSYNKFLAKLASDHRKPDGLFVITPQMGPEFVEALPVRKFHGVGPATAKKMERLGVKTGLDLRAQTLAFLQQQFGKAGSYYYWVARGIDERPVRADRIRKSVGAENTFPDDLFSYEAARDALHEIIDKVWSYCEGSGIRGRTVTLKVKFANFQQITRSRTGQMQIRTRSELEQLSNALLEPLFPVARGVRLLGVSLSSLAEASEHEPEFSLPV
jgi:nucleotidyltransferase/DNA polymerase involved in DNA repair